MVGAAGERWTLVLRAALVAALWPLLSMGPALAAAQGTRPSAPPLGLIVQLRDAPSHEHAAEREAALGVHHHSEAAAARSERRWQQVVRDAGLVAAGVVDAASLRRTGRAARAIDFARPLAPDEVAQWLQRLQAHPAVEWAVANDREPPAQATTPSDPMFDGPAGQWWLQLAGGSDAAGIEWRRRGVPDLQRAWARSNGRDGAAIAVLDSGVTPHPELADRLLPGVDLVSDPAMAGDGDGRDLDPTDPGDWVDDAARTAYPSLAGCAGGHSSWHGTATAGLIAARTDDNAGVAAINWHGRVVPVRVAGKCGAAVSDIVDGLRWAAGFAVPDGRGGWLPRNAHPVRVINLSFGSHAACHPAYQSVIDELRAHGVVVVASAGNDHGAVTRPANCRGVVAVAALNRDGFKTHYSSFGPQVTLATVGGDDAAGAWGAWLGDGGLLGIAHFGRTQPEVSGYARHAGTSFAAPLVAGTMSLMLSVNPQLSVERLIAGVTVTARPHVRSPWLAACGFDNPGRCLCGTSSCGAGILDAEQALIYAADPDAYAVPARQAEVLDNDELRAAAAQGADRPAAAPDVPEPATGGGSIDALALAALLAALAAPSAPRRRSIRPPRGR